MLDFKFKIQSDYITEFTKQLTADSFEEDEYNDLMDEFMYFCEVSGSVK